MKLLSKKGSINVSAMRHPYLPIAVVVLVVLPLVVSVVVELAVVCFFPVLSVAGFRVSLPLVLKMWTGRKNGFY